jgi:hypothetical protein
VKTDEPYKSTFMGWRKGDGDKNIRFYKAR